MASNSRVESSQSKEASNSSRKETSGEPFIQSYEFDLSTIFYCIDRDDEWGTEVICTIGYFERGKTELINSTVINSSLNSFLLSDLEREKFQSQFSLFSNFPKKMLLKQALYSTTSSSPQKVLIMGAGTVGPLLAIALKRAQFDVELFDSASEFKDVGGAFMLAPNGLRFAQNLGLLDKIYEGGTRNKAVQFLKLDGTPITTLNLGFVDKFGISVVGIKRFRFHTAIMEQVHKEGIPVHLNKRLKDLDQDTHKAKATFVDGTTVVGDLVIGCDGIKSATREALFGKEDPKLTGIEAILGITTLDSSLDLPSAVTRMYQGNGIQFGTYEIGKNERLWFVGLRGDGFSTESWDQETIDFRDKVASNLKKWGCNQVQQDLVLKSYRIMRYAICDREPLKSWTKGRVTLVGDAAHPMPPHLGQGANTALEDVGVLSELLKYLPYEEAFKQYEALRLKRTTNFLISSRYMASLNYIKSPLGCWIRDKMVKLAMERQVPPVEAMYRYDYLAETQKVLKSLS
jgi:salicylate hydroxylase